MSGPYVHPSAIVEDGAVIGDGTKIWHFVHVRAGAHIGDRVVLGKSVFVDAGVAIGSGSKVQNFVSVYSGVTIEDDVLVGPSVVFTNDEYPRATAADWTVVPTRIRRGAAIGANSTIRCGITVGRWATVGAGSVVTRDVDPHRLVVGNPARAVGWVCRCGHPVPAGPGTECAACGDRLQP